MYRAVQLLLILTAMRLPDEEEPIEALRLMGTYGVDARKRLAKERYGVAARDRPRPVKDVPSFKKRHLPRLQRSLTDSLHVLTRELDGSTCKQVLVKFGKEAVDKFLGRLQ